MCVIYLLHAGTKARKSGGRLIVESETEKISSVPLASIDQIVASRNSQITTQTIYALLEEGKSIIYVNHLGIVEGVLQPVGMDSRKLLLQLKSFQDDQFQITLIRKILLEKLSQQQKLLLTQTSHIPNKPAIMHSKGM